MNKKLRLVLTYECPKKCEGCCNQYYDLPESITMDEIIKSDYEEIYITGGEPMMKIPELVNLLRTVKFTGKKLYIYSAMWTEHWAHVLKYIDGITFTIHEAHDEPDFWFLEYAIRSAGYGERLSLRVNVFDHFKMLKVPPANWQVKFIHWIKDCPIPEGEDLRRLV